MTTFVRRAHTRRSANGGEHWVTDHLVTRRSALGEGWVEPVSIFPPTWRSDFRRTHRDVPWNPYWVIARSDEGNLIFLRIESAESRRSVAEWLVARAPDPATIQSNLIFVRKRRVAFCQQDILTLRTRACRRFREFTTFEAIWEKWQARPLRTKEAEA